MEWDEAELERELGRQAWAEAVDIRAAHPDGKLPTRCHELIAEAHAHELEAVRLEVEAEGVVSPTRSTPAPASRGAGLPAGNRGEPASRDR